MTSYPRPIPEMQRPQPASRMETHSFDELYRNNADRVYMLSLRLTGNSCDASDLAAEVFGKAWRALPDFRGESAEFTWLYRLTVRAWSDIRRARSRRPIEVASTSLTEAEAVQYGAAAQHAPGESMDLERAVSALPNGAREVLVLRTIYGYSEAEVAVMLNVSRGTVKSQLHRARSLLLEALDR